MDLTNFGGFPPFFKFLCPVGFGGEGASRALPGEPARAGWEFPGAADASRSVWRCTSVSFTWEKIRFQSHPGSARAPRACVVWGGFRSFSDFLVLFFCPLSFFPLVFVRPFLSLFLFFRRSFLFFSLDFCLFSAVFFSFDFCLFSADWV